MMMESRKLPGWALPPLLKIRHSIGLGGVVPREVLVLVLDELGLAGAGGFDVGVRAGALVVARPEEDVLAALLVLFPMGGVVAENFCWRLF